MTLLALASCIQRTISAGRTLCLVGTRNSNRNAGPAFSSASGASPVSGCLVYGGLGAAHLLLAVPHGGGMTVEKVGIGGTEGVGAERKAVLDALKRPGGPAGGARETSGWASGDGEETRETQGVKAGRKTIAVGRHVWGGISEGKIENLVRRVQVSDHSNTAN